MHALAGLGNGPANRVPAGFIAGSTGHGVEHRRPSDAAGADAHACGVPDEPAAEADPSLRLRGERGSPAGAMRCTSPARGSPAGRFLYVPARINDQ
ncbi:MAG: hypothetical protein ACK50I_00795 [Burkholderiales bacterium]